MILEELFFEIGTVIVIAAALSLLIYRLRQPLIIAYLVAGVIVGPAMFGLTKSTEIFDVMSELGVAFLLFSVGLGLNWRSIKDVGGIALATGVGQVLFTSFAGLFIGLLLGFSLLTSVYLAVAFTFSSTIIIIKLLSDKEELDTLYGRISVGFLLVQDFIAMLILLALGSFQSGADLPTILTSTFVKAVILIPLLWAISTFIVPRLVSYAAKSQELLFIFAVAWCFLITGILVWLGFGVELGALISGVTLAGTLYHRDITVRIRPIRDFFLVIFFIVLGTQLDVSQLSLVVLPTIVFSLFILIGNPIIVMLIMRLLGYHPRTGFLAGTTVAQISEFSFIVVAAGIAAGHIESQALAISAAVGIVTIAASSYLISANEWIYDKIRFLFAFLEPKHILSIEEVSHRRNPTALVMGYHYIGARLITTLKKLKLPYFIVDFDPQVVRSLSAAGEPIIYGDAGDDQFLKDVGAHGARLVISTIPNLTISLSILRYLKQAGFKGTIIVTVNRAEEAAQCYQEGATYVIIPSVLGGAKLSEFFAKHKTRKTSWQTLGKEASMAFQE